MNTQTLINGKYTLFDGIPVLRENNVICCGDNSSKYILLLMIIKNKTVNTGTTEAEVPESILGQILATDTAVDPAKRMVKQFTCNSLMEAFDFGLTQLARYNKK